MKIGKKVTTVTSPPRRVQKVQPKPIPVEMPKVPQKVEGFKYIGVDFGFMPSKTVHWAGS